MNLKSKNWAMPKFRLPRVVIIIICALPVFLTGLFYALTFVTDAMEWAAVHISRPARGFLGLLSSVYPLSVMEVVCTAAVIWLIYYLVKTAAVTARRRNKWKIFGKRMLVLGVVAAYIWCTFCWLWNSGYHAHSFAKKNGFSSGGVAAGDLSYVARFFADKANELAPLVKRDDGGHYIESQSEILDAATGIYKETLMLFPSLKGKLYRPKTMLFSWLMSRTGYTGIYFALTVEANVNSQMPGCLFPATVAHELAHQLGVFAENETNFVGVVACINSGNTAYEYSGYLSGLMSLRNALYYADSGTWAEISAGLCAEVNIDLEDNRAFWQRQETVETGVTFIDNILTTVTDTVSDAVDTVYDGYLKSQSQELGIRSYGACVDLLVEYYKYG